MGILQAIKNTRFIRATIGILLIGVVFFVAGIAVTIHASKVTWIDATATVTSIETSYDSDNQLETRAYVEFKVGKKTIEDVFLGLVDNGTEVGDEVAIKYNQDDPTEVASGNPKTIGIVFIIVGFLTAVFGAFKTLRQLS